MYLSFSSAATGDVPEDYTYRAEMIDREMERDIQIDMQTERKEDINRQICLCVFLSVCLFVFIFISISLSKIAGQEGRWVERETGM